MQFAPVAQMFDKTEIVTDCHKNSHVRSAQSPELAVGAAKLRAASSSASGWV
jgi:hypothetical protein